MFNFREATYSDLEPIMQIIAQCQALLRERGVDQWQDGYPSREPIERDIDLHQGYLLECNGQIAAYAALVPGAEPSYLTIQNGAWLSSLPYLTMHRLAVGEHVRGEGVGAMFFAQMEREARHRGIKSLRADTHRDNLVMQRLLSRMGFTLCGDVYLPAHRFGFERLL